MSGGNLATTSNIDLAQYSVTWAIDHYDEKDKQKPATLIELQDVDSRLRDLKKKDIDNVGFNPGAPLAAQFTQLRENIDALEAKMTSKKNPMDAQLELFGPTYEIPEKAHLRALLINLVESDDLPPDAATKPADLNEMRALVLAGMKKRDDREAKKKAEEALRNVKREANKVPEAASSELNPSTIAIVGAVGAAVLATAAVKAVAGLAAALKPQRHEDLKAYVSMDTGPLFGPPPTAAQLAGYVPFRRNHPNLKTMTVEEMLASMFPPVPSPKAKTYTDEAARQVAPV